MDIIERLLSVAQLGSRWVPWLLIALSIAAIAGVGLYFTNRSFAKRDRERHHHDAAE